MPFGFNHELVCLISRSALWSFFSDIELQDVFNVPSESQPLIVAATHHNMIIDPAVLSVSFPKQRRLHYWAKDSMFKLPYVAAFLHDCGVVPVDRKTKNNAQLYAATFEVLKLGEAVAVFPEGTSHTLPRLGAFKDGTSFAALEYAKIVEQEKQGQFAPVLPVGIVYPEKSKYRSTVIVKYGKPISVEPYLPLYLEDPKKAAKQLTKAIENAIERITVNAPDWNSKYAADMARWLLFPGENEDVEIAKLQKSLVVYKLELESLLLKDNHIAKYNEKEITPISTTIELLHRTAACLIDLPLFFPGLVVHLPLYVAGYYAGQCEIYEEVRAQNKILYGMILISIIYLSTFIWGWFSLFSGTFFGFFCALATLGIFMWYHIVSIDERYEGFKDLQGRWRLFDAVVLGRGMWRRKERILKLKRLRTECLAELAVDLLNPSVEHEKRSHKLKRLVQSPNSYFMDVKCPGCLNISTVFSHAQTVVLCSSCGTVLCQPTGGRARLTEGCSFRKKAN
ncbi:hypothetical protein G6F57_008042 [Rhizopus arrhizus]|uniref:40S ribosomal protein S27 n=1 Tax=Rhizopus oryzae TaxID=64495 RepID=A0A9P6X618_RHIOR|nr:hypothetical protein G6F23_007042 [Rhizopus arrhizus]KAG1413239.1 hypothetical protein G6F58_007601 [Rhizopus delemar]KAG0758118.1 hypothetical protein G6F24_010028 [Rhizopus arrhizus]KAG0791359.1 hypothetical protein G6F21_005144 [Rhizopus arrhizus]KAG0795727.1 hypothetical protein G6F22_005053 [Rhizopus arrhizus]